MCFPDSSCLNASLQSEYVEEEGSTNVLVLNALFARLLSLLLASVFGAHSASIWVVVRHGKIPFSDVFPNRVSIVVIGDVESLPQ